MTRAATSARGPPNIAECAPRITVPLVNFL